MNEPPISEINADLSSENGDVTVAACFPIFLIWVNPKSATDFIYGSTTSVIDHPLLPD